MNYSTEDHRTDMLFQPTNQEPVRHPVRAAQAGRSHPVVSSRRSSAVSSCSP